MKWGELSEKTEWGRESEHKEDKGDATVKFVKRHLSVHKVVSVFYLYFYFSVQQ